MKKLRAIEENVVVMPQTAPEKEGSIHIPEKAQKRPQIGEVLSLGSFFEATNPTLKVGDVVMYPQYAGTEVVLDDVTYLVLKAEDIFGVVEDA